MILNIDSAVKNFKDSSLYYAAIEVFIHNAKLDLERIDRAIVRNNINTALKPCAALLDRATIVKAEAVKEIAQKMESLVRKSNSDDMPELIRQMREAIVELEKVFKEEGPKLKKKA